MILYDQNYNFIGMSNETLSYLGYEDLADFTSQHSDFANLLANKEGYIYKFQNFSWIDFILYSGSPNKSALLKLKNGDELEIKLSVKEVHLTADMNGNTKFYSVRILSDNFVNIASKTDASIAKQSPAKNSFNLNSLISEETPAAKTAEEKTTEVINTPAPQEEVARPTENDFVLNFPSSDEIKEPESSPKLDLSEPEEEPFILSEPAVSSEDEAPFKLNFEETITTSEEEITTPEIPQEEFSLNFLKTDDVPIIEEVEEEVLVKDDSILLDDAFLKSTEPEIVAVAQEPVAEEPREVQEFILQPRVEKERQEEESTLSMNFLKPEETLPEETLIEKEVIQEEEELSVEDIENSPSSFITQEETNLNFLAQSTADSEDEISTVADKDKIIAQIKNDIEEIDTVEEKAPKAIIKEEEPILQSEDLSAELFNKNEVKKEKKSFTKTLKSLFAEDIEESPTSKDDTFINLLQEPDATLKKNDLEPLKHLVQEEVQASVTTMPSLTGLGLDKEEENELISEFIYDTKNNIDLFKEYHYSSNVDQAEYILIKMQSSADILNLNDIISTLSEIKLACKEAVPGAIDSLTHTLESQVNTLEMHIESETV